MGKYDIDFVNWSSKHTLFSATRRKAVSWSYDQFVRSNFEGFTVLEKAHRWVGPSVWSQRANISKMNYFFWSYVAYSDEISAPWWDDAREAVRFGGSAWDAVRALKYFDHIYPEVSQPDASEVGEFMKFLGWEDDRLVPLPPDGYKDEVIVRELANPGPTFLSLGIRCKSDAVRISMCMLKSLLDESSNTNSLPSVYYGLGGRGKPTTFRDIEERKTIGKTVGRAVWMADAHETVLSWMFTQPLTQLSKRSQNVCMIGYNKWKLSDRSRLLRDLDEGNAFMSGDLDRYDSTVPPGLIRIAFRVIRHLFRGMSPVHESILGWLEEQYIHSLIVCPDGWVYRKHGGIPSGSGMTSMVGSICNAYALWCASRHIEKSVLRPDERINSIRVYGDDNLVTMHLGYHRHNARWYRLCRISEAYAEYLKEKFGLELSVAKTRKSVDPYVKIVTPKSVGDEFVHDHSRRVMREHPIPYYDRKKRSVRYAEGIEAFVIRRHADVAEHSQLRDMKRFNYMFSGTVSFLQSHYLDNGQPIRPKPDMMARLSTTSQVIESVYEWRGLLQQYIIEHWFNASSRGELLSMWCDSFYMEQEGVISRADALYDIYKSDVLKQSRVRQHKEATNFQKLQRTDADHRQWWANLEYWWPDLSDWQFGFIKNNVKALYKMVHGVIDGAICVTEVLERLRPSLLSSNVREIFGANNQKVEGAKAFSDLFARVAGVFSNADSFRVFNWEASDAEWAIARQLLSPDKTNSVGPSVLMSLGRGRYQSLPWLVVLRVDDRGFYLQRGVSLELVPVVCG